MSKQQLIDKAISDIGGCEELFRHGSEFLFRTELPSGLHAYWWESEMKSDFGELICTRKQLEDRKAEREKASSEMFSIMFGNSLPNFKQDHWYDYENQKALRLPPVGEAVEFKSKNFNWFSGAKVVFVTEYVIVVDGDAGANETAQVAYNYGEHPEFRPLDWNKLRISAVNELTDIIKASAIDGVSAVGIADSILAAGYRKCHNKTPSDKE